MAACAGHVTLGRLGLAGLIFVIVPAAPRASAYEPAPAAASFAYSISHAVTPLPDAVIERTIDRDGVPFDYDDGDSFEHPPEKPHDPRLGPPRGLSRSAVRHHRGGGAHLSVAGAVLRQPDLQESSFNPRDVSRAGAQGIAQFMPKTAIYYGLINPFEPIHALNVAARFLRELHGRFGNLGLAAAAYNAGPGRVSNWLAKRGALPGETRNYVIRITGRVADRWIAAAAGIDPDMTLMPAKAPCAEVAAAVERQAKVVRVGKLMSELVAAAAAAARTDGCRETNYCEVRRRQIAARSKQCSRPKSRAEFRQSQARRKDFVSTRAHQACRPRAVGARAHQARQSRSEKFGCAQDQRPSAPRRGVGKRTKVASS